MSRQNKKFIFHIRARKVLGPLTFADYYFQYNCDGTEWTWQSKQKLATKLDSKQLGVAMTKVVCHVAMKEYQIGVVLAEE